MSSAKVVLGSNFGDEGKGNCTNFLSNQNCTVVRFNGGAQAGHTVCMPDGRRHVFGHIGSGTFKGAATHLSRFFICNPILFEKEYNKLSLDPKLTADPNCMVTTHYDMFINQITEMYRNKNKHGSCGVGINETIHRHKIIPIWFGGLTSKSLLQNTLKLIREEYLPDRLYKLGVPDSFWIKHPFFELNVTESLDNSFIDSCTFFRRAVARLDDIDLPEDNLIFEGAQGLLLDQDHEYFPYVTHSKTGFDNIIELIKPLGIDYVEAYFCSRTYLTRHGAGPFPTECKLAFEVKDETNINNKWQGSLRLGTLDTENLITRILGEAAKMPPGITTNIKLFLTCCDQIPEQALYHLESLLVTKPIKSFSPYGPTL